MEYFYFHNCLYERVWKENRRRWQETTPTWDVLHTYAHDYKVIFVGDASMSPYEIVQPAARSSTSTTSPARCGLTVGRWFLVGTYRDRAIERGAGRYTALSKRCHD
jgi:hypothetical protein